MENTSCQKKDELASAKFKNLFPFVHTITKNGEGGGC